MSFRALLASGCFLPLFLILAGCTEDPVGPGGVAVIEIVGMPVSLEEGDTVRLSANLSDWNRAPLSGVTIEWTSDDPAIASVSAEGLVTAVAAGATTIRAAAGGARTSARLTVTTPAALRFATLVAGPNHTCGLTSEGALYCWGYNRYGQLGTTDMGDGCSITNWQGQVETVACSARPLRVHGPARFKTVSLGMFHTCAITMAGVSQCWGSNDWENLGASWDVSEMSASPITVPGQHQFSQISAGNWFSCGLTPVGKAYCWGSHAWGELGTGDLELFTSPTPVEVVGGHAFTMLAGGSLHNCGLLASGEAYCWGDFQMGEIGIGYFPPPDLWWPAEPTPTPVAGGHLFRTIGAGFQYTCGLTMNGAIYCWGEGTRGRLGNGSAENQPSPVPVAGVESYTSLTVGAEHACAVTTTGRIACWGNNETGALGVSSTGETCPAGYGRSPLPCASRPVYWSAKASIFPVIRAGGIFTCALDDAGYAYCWGANGSGQLGSGFVGGSSSTPIRVLPPQVK